MSASIANFFPVRIARERATLRLVCFPFAGGTAAAYKGWGADLPEHVDVCAFELPGHGTRFGDPPVGEMDPIVDEAMKALALLPDLPLVVTGHSVGARIGFALAQRASNVRMFIATGCRAPHLKARTHRSDLSDDGLIAEIKKLGGTPPEVLADRDLMDLFLPVLRADFSVNEHWTAPREAKLDVPMVAIGSRDDTDAPLDDVRAWEHHTTKSFRFFELPDGGHFFITSRRANVLSLVRDALGELSKTGG